MQVSYVGLKVDGSLQSSNPFGSPVKFKADVHYRGDYIRLVISQLYDQTKCTRCRDPLNLGFGTKYLPNSNLYCWVPNSTHNYAVLRWSRHSSE